MNKIQVIFGSGSEHSKLIIDKMVIDFLDIDVEFDEKKTFVEKVVVLGTDYKPAVTIKNRSDIYKFLDVVIPTRYYDDVRKIYKISSLCFKDEADPLSRQEIEDILRRTFDFMENYCELLSLFTKQGRLYFYHLEKVIYNISGTLWNLRTVEDCFDTIVEYILSGEKKILLYPSNNCDYHSLVSDIRNAELAIEKGGNNQ